MKSCQLLKITRAGKCRLSTCDVLAVYLGIVLVLTTFTSGSAYQQVCLLPGDATCSGPPPSPPPCPPFVNTVIAHCPSSVVTGVFGTLTFPATLVNQDAESEERCSEYVNSTSKPKPRGRRRCVCELPSAIWEDPKPANCLSGIGGDYINDLLWKIAQAYVTAENVTEYSYDVRSATVNASDINADGLRAIAIALSKIVATMVSSEEVTQNTVQIVDNVLNVTNREFVEATDYEAPTIILDSLEEQITFFQTQGDGTNLTVIGNNVAIVALQVPESSLKAGLGFGTVTSSGPEKNESVLKDLIQTMVFYNTDYIPSTMFDASILLPSYLLETLPPNAKENGSAPVTFLIFQNSKLFQASEPGYVNVTSRQQLVGTRVISATVEGVVIEGLPQGREVETTFLELNVTLGNETVDNRACVFWEKTDQGGRWSPEGCRREDLPNINRIRCLCNHLTSFAVLLDFSGDGGHKILDVLSLIGCIISIICLVITMVTYLSMKNLRAKQPQQILINLCFTLLGLYLVFVVGIDRRSPTAGCVAIGFLIHFFLLSSISWMTVEAVNMYLLFVKVFNATVTHFLLKASLCAYGLPLLVCIITVAVDSSLYLGDNSYCFVKPGPALYYGVMLIVAVLLIVNFIIFGIVMQRLSCRKSVEGTNQGYRRAVWRRVQNAVAVTTLLGLTWLFGFLAIGGARLLFNILFLVFNSLQGFFIFVMFCVRQNEVVEQWKQWLHCHFSFLRPEQSQKEKYIKTKKQTTGSSHGELSSMEMSSNRERKQIGSETLSISESSVQT